MLFRIRPVNSTTDTAAIQSIYSLYVLNSVASFELDPPSVEEMGQRVQKTLDAGYPWYVAVEDAKGMDEVIGYAYASAYRPRAAYRFTCEDSVYISPTHTRRGIGLALLRRLFYTCETLGYRQMIAVISDPQASVPLHTKLGFAEMGRTKSVGWKFGQWIDVVTMARALGEGGETAPTGEVVKWNGKD